MRSEADTVRFTLLMILGARPTIDELNDAVGTAGETLPVVLAGLTLTVRLTLPANPLILDTEIMDWPDEPTETLREDELAAIPKSVTYTAT